MKWSIASNKKNWQIKNWRKNSGWNGLSHLLTFATAVKQKQSASRFFSKHKKISKLAILDLWNCRSVFRSAQWWPLTTLGQPERTRCWPSSMQSFHSFSNKSSKTRKLRWFFVEQKFNCLADLLLKAKEMRDLIQQLSNTMKTILHNRWSASPSYKPVTKYHHYPYHQGHQDDPIYVELHHYFDDEHWGLGMIEIIVFADPIVCRVSSIFWWWW